MGIVRVLNLQKTYQENKISVCALNGINLSIEQGDFLAIAGPSGSGKTTLLNIIGGLDIPTEGEVFLGDMNLTTMKQSELADIRLKKIGFIFQSYNLIPVLTAMENVEFVMMLQKMPREERREKAFAILNELGIGELSDRRPSDMSGGQQQRVAVARAIVSDPLIVLADEPTANLDSATGANLLDIMAVMNSKKGITFIFSTHDRMVMECAHRLVLLKDGQIALDDYKKV